MYLQSTEWISKKLIFFGILKATDEKSRIQIRIRSPVYGYKDPDPYKNVTDPEHIKIVSSSTGSIQRSWSRKSVKLRYDPCLTNLVWLMSWNVDHLGEKMVSRSRSRSRSRSGRSRTRSRWVCRPSRFGYIFVLSLLLIVPVIFAITNTTSFVGPYSQFWRMFLKFLICESLSGNLFQILKNGCSFSFFLWHNLNKDMYNCLWLWYRL
jgi:hypothetical protein